MTGKITLGLTVYFQNSDYVDDDRDDDTYNIWADINYQIKDRIALYFSAGYENRDSTIPDAEFENTEILGQVRFFHELAK